MDGKVEKKGALCAQPGAVSCELGCGVQKPNPVGCSSRVLRPGEFGGGRGGRWRRELGYDKVLVVPVY